MLRWLFNRDFLNETEFSIFREWPGASDIRNVGWQFDSGRCEVIQN